MKTSARHLVEAILLAGALGTSVPTADGQARPERCVVRGVECSSLCSAGRGALICDPPVNQCRSECGSFAPGDVGANIVIGLATRAPNPDPKIVLTPALEAAVTSLFSALKDMRPLNGTYVAIFRFRGSVPQFLRVNPIESGRAPQADENDVSTLFIMSPQTWERVRSLSAVESSRRAFDLAAGQLRLRMQ